MKKNYAYLLALILLVIGTNNLNAQCIPTGVSTVFGTVTGSTGTQTFNNVPTGNVVRITAPAAGTFYTISMCQTNGGVAQADGIDDSQLTILDVNSAAAVSLGFNDDFCPTTGVNGYGPSEVNYTAAAAGDVFVYLTEWNAGGTASCIADGVNTGYTMTVTITGTPPACTAGGLTTAGYPLSICPGDTFTAASDGTESTPGGIGVFFSPQATGGGGLGGAFTLSGVTYPYTGDNDLNGVLSSNSFPLLTGEYAIYLVSYSDVTDAANTICSTSTDSIMVTFLTSSDPSCTAVNCDNGDVAATLDGTVQNICPGDSVSLMTDGNQVVNAGETYGWFFQSNTMVDSIYFVTGPVNYFGDLNADLIAAGADAIPNDSYTVAGFATDSGGTVICGGTFTTGNFTVNFLDSTDPLCTGTPPGTPCTTSAAGPYTNLNTAGGAPCDDGTGCTPTTVAFEAWASEAYLLDNVQAGFDYVFDICSGAGAGAWMPAITIEAPSGAVDAFNLGTTGTFAMNCTQAWTASESGTYIIYIHEAGTTCLDSNSINNGTPTVTCGTVNPPTCLPCTAGTLTSASSMVVCSNSTDSLTLTGESTPGTYTVAFSDAPGGAGGLAGGFSIINIASFPWEFDNDIMGVLSANSLPVLTGMWDLTIYNIDSDTLVCDSVATTITVNFVDSTDVLCTGAATCAITAITAGTQTPCNATTNTYSQDITVTYTDAPATGTIDVNGQSFAITSSPQTVTLVNLVSDGNAVDVMASFSADAACTMTQTSVFVAPVSCACSITDITAGTQTPCVNTTNLYTQDVTVFYTNAPTTGMLNVNGQTFTITSSPQTVTLSSLNSDGAMVNVNVSFTANASCVYSENAVFMAPAGCLCPTINVNVTTTNVTNCSSPDGTATAMATGGTGSYTYVWTPNSFGSGATISNIPSGSYSVIATDGNGCTGMGSSIVNNTSGVNALVGAVNNVSCFGANDGEINISASGGVAPISYTWSDQGFASTVSSRNTLTAGFYTITVADNGGCSVVLGPIEITQPDQLVAVVDNSSNVTCFGANDGEINVTVTGGNGNNSYSWTNGGGNAEDASNLGGGNYVLTVTDAGCPSVSTNTVNINEPSAINVVVDNLEDVSCFGANDGNILVSTSGGTGSLTYNWNNAPNMEDVLNTGGGSYQLTVTDANNCSAQSAMLTINEPAELVVSIDAQQDVSCFQSNNGSITASVTGGTGAMNIMWTNGAGSSLNPTNLAPNSYQLTVTDANNCSDVSSIVTISEPSFVTASTSSTNESLSGGDGTATVTASGGTAPYSYSWNDGNNQSTSAATSLSAGTYSCLITDANGCTHTVSVEVGKASSIGELALEELTIFPNPSNGSFTIEFETSASLNFDITVKNTIGKTVYSNLYENVNGTFNEVFNLENLSSGVYFIELGNEDAKTVRRITISK